MSLKTKILVGIVVAVAAVAAVTGIAYLSARQEEPVEEPGLYVGGERVEDPGVMMSVGDNEIGFDEYRYYYLMNKTYFESQYGESVWDTDYDGSMALELRRGTEDTIRVTYAVLALAEEEGISLSEEDKQEILETMEKQKEELGEEGFQKNLADMYFTSEEMYIRITENQRLVQKTQDVMREEYTEEFEENIDEHILTASHILLSFDAAEEGADSAVEEQSTIEESGAEEESAPAESVSGAEDENAEGEAESGADASLEEEGEEAEEEMDPSEAAVLARAQELLAQLRQAEAEGADMEALFSEMVEEYGQDPGMEENPGGYTFGEGEMMEEFYEGALALQPGEISEPIRTDYGYHIIMRLPLNQEEAEAKKETMISNAVNTEIGERLDAIEENNMPVSYGSYYAEVNPQSIK